MAYSIPTLGFKTGIDDGLKNVIRADEATVLDARLAVFQRYLDLTDAWQVLNGVGQGPNRGFVGQTANLEKHVLHAVAVARSVQSWFGSGFPMKFAARGFLTVSRAHRAIPIAAARS